MILSTLLIAAEKETSATKQFYELIDTLEDKLPSGWEVKSELKDGKYINLKIRKKEDVQVAYPNLIKDLYFADTLEFEFSNSDYVSVEEYKRFILSNKNNEMRRRKVAESVSDLLDDKYKNMSPKDIKLLGNGPFRPGVHSANNEKDVQRLLKYAFVWEETALVFLPDYYYKQLSFWKWFRLDIIIKEEKHKREYDTVLKIINTTFKKY